MLKAIVDIGPHGTRFSINSLDPRNARVLPCLYSDSAAISLFEHGSSVGVASGSGGLSSATASVAESGTATPTNGHDLISEQITATVCNALVRFKFICQDFGVPDSQVYVLLGEATCEARNVTAFGEAITEATGWTTTHLSKNDEGKMAVYGVASSFHNIHGLYMDLGGGSVQLSWIISADGKLQMAEVPVYLPYGSAVLTRKLARESREAVTEKLKAALLAALRVIDIPKVLEDEAKKTGGYRIYLSGGGFRVLGRLLMAYKSTAERPYPLPMINGLTGSDTDLRNLINPDTLSQQLDISLNSDHRFRVSERRVSQLSAVALLLECALDVLPHIRKVLFTQSSPREGALFHDLPLELRAQDPLIIATRAYAPRHAERYITLLRSTLPKNVPSVIVDRLVPALVNTSFVHSSYPKEIQPLCALNIASTGQIANSHGIAHDVRALLGMALCKRWSGELPDDFIRDSFLSVPPRNLSWWTMYCGMLMHVIGGVYPGGFLHLDNSIQFEVRDEDANKFALHVFAKTNSLRANASTVKSRINNLEKRVKKNDREFKEMSVKIFTHWV